MKKIILISSAILLSAACSCNKEEMTVTDTQGNAEIGEEIVLDVKDGAVTKSDATAVTSIPDKLYVSMTKGTAGSSETSYLEPSQMNVSSGKIATGVYQGSTPLAYNYYVSNASLTFSATGATVTTSNTTDVIAGTTAASSLSSPTISLEHIFARTGSITLKSDQGYTVSEISAKIIQTNTTNVTGTAGTYNLAEGKWTAASARLAIEKTLSNDSDYYLIPGTYSVTMNYTLTKGAFTKKYTKKGQVTLVQGKINNITGTVSDNEATAINIDVTLEPWNTQDVTITW